MNKETLDFDAWNEQKKRIQASSEPVSLFPKNREVWMCILGKNIGFEQDGSNENYTRPILVIKKFNNQMFWIAPLSSKQKELSFYFNFVDENGPKYR